MHADGLGCHAAIDLPRAWIHVDYVYVQTAAALYSCTGITCLAVCSGHDEVDMDELEQHATGMVLTVIEHCADKGDAHALLELNKLLQGFVEKMKDPAVTTRFQAPLVLKSTLPEACMSACLLKSLLLRLVLHSYSCKLQAASCLMQHLACHVVSKRLRRHGMCLRVLCEQGCWPVIRHSSCVQNHVQPKQPRGSWIR